MRVTKEVRKHNALKWYNTFVNGINNKAAIVVNKNKSTTNPYVNRIQFMAVASSLAFMEQPTIIAESSTLGIDGCFIELLNFINDIPQVTYHEQGFNE
mgnify:CR=1 FL=1